jgi:hypothetical protein
LNAAEPPHNIRFEVLMAIKILGLLICNNMQTCRQIPPYSPEDENTMFL